MPRRAMGKAKPKTILCRVCGKRKQWTKKFFYATKKGGTGLKRTCKVCYPKSNPQEKRRHHLWYTYGLTLEDYKILLQKQKRSCAICKTKNPGGRFKTWNIDHVHRNHVIKSHTGATQKEKVRGLLCWSCNVMIGFAKDDPKILYEIAKYLEKNI